MRRRRDEPPRLARRSAGTSNARSPPKLSEFTSPKATSSASAASTCVGRRRAVSTISSKNKAPSLRKLSATARALAVSCSSGNAVVNADQALRLRRAINAIGVERTGAAPRCGSATRAARRVHTKRPDKQCSSSHAGSYSLMRAGSISVSHAPAGSSVPSSCPRTAATASGPCMREFCATRCHSKRKRMKSRGATGSISARSRLTV